ncbi:MAG: NAD(P)/FAD-dependent oxidoreductase [Anaerovoracaceae bacterium]
MSIAIVGGGASGMMAAIGAGEQISGENIVIIEKNSVVGRKVLATGNGRCNLTNVNCTSEDYACGSVEKNEFVKKAMKAFGYERTVNKFHEIGLMTRLEEAGREYPYDGQASSVTGALESRIRSMGIQVMTEAVISRIERIEDGFVLITEDERTFFADKVILATGGKAGMQYGSAGDGYGFAKGFGLKMVKPRPALVRMKVDCPNFSQAKGVRAKGRVMLASDGKEIAYAEGEVQFAEKALSGICIFDISRFYRRDMINPHVIIDLFPHFSYEELLEKLYDRMIFLKERRVNDFLDGMLHPKLKAFYLSRWIGDRRDFSVSTLSREDIECLPKILKAWELPVYGTAGWKESQVSGGGVDVSQVLPETMEIEGIKGLYVAGELLDVDGPCGGWNLQWAWTSGYLAGRAAAKDGGGVSFG